MIIRREQPRDHDAIRSVVEGAFGGPAEARLVDDLRHQGALAVSLVAEIEDRILGHIALSALTSPQRALALAPLAVAPPFQRLGIGSALVREAIDLCGHSGAAAIFVLGDPGYYGRFGFSADAAAPFPSPYAGRHFMMLRVTSREIAIEPVVYADSFGRLG
jgi:putative acetyltransferase